jgi:hypothetical protein
MVAEQRPLKLIGLKVARVAHIHRHHPPLAREVSSAERGLVINAQIMP